MAMILPRNVSILLGLYACFLIVLPGNYATAISTNEKSEASMESNNLRSNEPDSDRIRRLRRALAALQYAGKAEAQAAAQERMVGSKKISLAQRTAREAATLIQRADSLLRSEEALKFEQAHVAKKLGDLADVHQNTLTFTSCHQSSEGCSADLQDVWQKGAVEAQAQIPSVQSGAMSQHSFTQESLRSAEPKQSNSARAVESPSSLQRWIHTYLSTHLQYFKQQQLKAGYHLYTCLVAAEQDTSSVQVRIVQPKTIIQTAKGCRCLDSWDLYTEVSQADGDQEESKEAVTMSGCTDNGSPGQPWCAVKGSTCGAKSQDPHAGIGPDKYNWTNWDYCKEPRTVDQPVWGATHSAGQVTCLADFMVRGSRKTELLALSLVAQQDDAGAPTGPELPPAVAASGYQACLRDAPDADSAVYCEAVLLRGMAESVVRHAMLISRSKSRDVVRANRRRTYILYAQQAKICLDKARRKKEGVCCLAQLLGSMPAVISQEAKASSSTLPPTGQPPADVPVLTSRLVSCLKASVDDFGAAFCVAKLLQSIPRSTVREAARSGQRVRDFGVQGFTDVPLGPGSPPGLHSFCGAHQ